MEFWWKSGTVKDLIALEIEMLKQQLSLVQKCRQTTVGMKGPIVDFFLGPERSALDKVWNEVF